MLIVCVYFSEIISRPLIGRKLATSPGVVRRKSGPSYKISSSLNMILSGLVRSLNPLPLPSGNFPSMSTFFCDTSTKTNFFSKASPGLVDAASDTLRLVDSLLKATNVTVPLVLEVKIDYRPAGLF